MLDLMPYELRNYADKDVVQINSVIGYSIIISSIDTTPSDLLDMQRVVFTTWDDVTFVADHMIEKLREDQEIVLVKTADIKPDSIEYPYYRGTYAEDSGSSYMIEIVPIYGGSVNKIK